MKSLKENSRLLVEQVLNERFLDANSTLAKLITEAEENREEEVAESLGIEDDEDAASEGSEEEINTDDIGEPDNGSPNLGDSLDQSVEEAGDQSVGEGEMTEMSNDVVEINCEINQKIISKLYDKISNLKTTLNAKDLDHDTREYITLETKLSYYGNKLEELQSKTNPAIDQTKVEERINIIDAALKSLEAEIGGSDEISDVESTDELENTEAEGEGEEGEGTEEETVESEEESSEAAEDEEAEEAEESGEGAEEEAAENEAEASEGEENSQENA